MCQKRQGSPGGLSDLKEGCQTSRKVVRPQGGLLDLNTSQSKPCVKHSGSGSWLEGQDASVQSWSKHTLQSHLGVFGSKLINKLAPCFRAQICTPVTLTHSWQAARGRNHLNMNSVSEGFQWVRTVALAQSCSLPRWSGKHVSWPPQNLTP